MSEKDIESNIVRLSGKVDSLQRAVSQLSTVIESLARIEEKIAHQKNDVDGFGHRLEVQERRLREMEIKQALSTSQGGTTSRWVERIVMFIVVAALGALNFFKDK